MRYLALFTDYDGVIASDGRASSEALSAIKRLRLSGRRAILITGRRLESLRESCPDLSMFDYVVAENGAIVYEPRTREETFLAKPPPPEFVERLRELGAEPLEVGQVIVSTWAPHEISVLRVIQETGLELYMIFNRAAVMVLPAGVNKATGMDFVLRKLGLSRHEVIAVGDAENDCSFLERSECSATVANAVPSIRKLVDIVTKGENGAGLTELIDEFSQAWMITLAHEELHALPRGIAKRKRHRTRDIHQRQPLRCLQTECNEIAPEFEATDEKTWSELCALVGG